MAKPLPLGADDRIKGRQFACKSFKTGKAGSLGQDALLTRFTPQFGDGDVYERVLKKGEPMVGKLAFFSSNLGGREVSLDVRKSAVRSPGKVVCLHSALHEEGHPVLTNSMVSRHTGDFPNPEEGRHTGETVGGEIEGGRHRKHPSWPSRAHTGRSLPNSPGRAHPDECCADGGPLSVPSPRFARG